MMALILEIIMNLYKVEMIVQPGYDADDTDLAKYTYLTLANSYSEAVALAAKERNFDLTSEFVNVNVRLIFMGPNQCIAINEGAYRAIS